MGYWVYKDQTRMTEKRESHMDGKRVAHSQGLESVEVDKGSESFSLKLKDKAWWIVKPIHYPVSPEFMVRSLKVMNQVVADSVFPMTEDRFNFSKSTTKMKLSYSDGSQKNLVLSPDPMVQSKIYILNSKENNVYVIHNVWGQLFYYGYDQIIDKGLPFATWKISEVEYIHNEKSLWKATLENKSWTITEGGQSYEKPSHKLLWWLRRLKELKVSPKEFSVASLKNFDQVLRVKTPGKQEELYFNSEASQVYISSLKAIAEMDPSSLQLVDRELKKVINDAK